MSDVTGVAKYKEIGKRNLENFGREVYAVDQVKTTMVVSIGSIVVGAGVNWALWNYFSRTTKKWTKEQNEAQNKKIEAYHQWTRNQNDAQNNKIEAYQQFTRNENVAQNNKIEAYQQLARNENGSLKFWVEGEFIKVGKKFADLFEKAGPNLDLDKTITTSIAEILKDVLNNKTLQQEVEKVDVQKFGGAYNLKSARQLIPPDVMINIDEEFLTRIEEGSKAVCYDDKIPLEDKVKALGKLAVDEKSRMQTIFFEHIARAMHKGVLKKLPRL